jgi:hypothetical protein
MDAIFPLEASEILFIFDPIQHAPGKTIRSDIQVQSSRLFFWIKPFQFIPHGKQGAVIKALYGTLAPIHGLTNFGI